MRLVCPREWRICSIDSPPDNMACLKDAAPACTLGERWSNLDERLAMKTGGDLLFLTRVWKKISSHLLNRKLVEAEVSIDGVNNPVAVERAGVRESPLSHGMCLHGAVRGLNEASNLVFRDPPGAFLFVRSLFQSKH